MGIKDWIAKQSMDDNFFHKVDKSRKKSGPVELFFGMIFTVMIVSTLFYGIKGCVTGEGSGEPRFSPECEYQISIGRSC